MINTPRNSLGYRRNEYVLLTTKKFFSRTDLDSTKTSYYYYYYIFFVFMY